MKEIKWQCAGPHKDAALDYGRHSERGEIDPLQVSVYKIQVYIARIASLDGLKDPHSQKQQIR